MFTDSVSLDWRTVLDALPEMAWLANTSGAVVYFNRAWYDYTGLSEAEALGLKGMQAIHPDDRNATRVAWFASSAGSKPMAQSLRLRARDGSFRWFIARARPIAGHDGAVVAWIGTTTDINQRRQVEQERRDLSRDLEIERGRLQSIIDHAPVGIIIAELPSGAIVGGNPQVEAILGHATLHSQNVEAYRDWEGFHADGRRFEAQEYPLARALTGETSSAEIHYRRGDGSRIWIHTTGAPLRDANGAITGSVVFFFDIDAIKRAQDEQATLLRNEQAARAVAEAAVSERDALIASITHDLKNPLTVIRGQVDMLRRKLPDPASEAGSRTLRRLGQIDNTVMRMVSQIDELIDAARLRAGQTLNLHRDEVDIVALVKRATAAFTTTTSLHEIVWEPSMDTLVGFWDENRLERVINNLLSNAIKYSPNGGIITVSVGAEQQAGETWACVTVHDQGIGIPAADLDNIFELFMRSTSHAGYYAGAGIGLASVRNIVRQHGGTIDVTSVEGSGSTFVVHLPLTS